jgi:predicted amidohydrolase
MNRLTRTLKIACIQLKVGSNKTENVARALEKIREAKMNGAELVSLPGIEIIFLASKKLD